MRITGAVLVLAASMLAGCGASGGTSEATWVVAPDEELSSGTTTFTALVTRLGCNSGVTGTVEEPRVRLTDEQVILTFQVSPGDPAEAECPGNDAVPYVVELPEPLGDRALVDGACEDRAIAGTAPCSAGAVRFVP
jgi:hypothetical protein